MIPIETLLPFFTASVILALSPGPDNVFVLTQSALQGKQAGLTVVAGLCTGLIVHSTSVALGVAAIFQTSTLAFSMLKFIGAGYLLYLAWQTFGASTTNIQAGSCQETNLWKLYRRGIVMNITNPKVSIFFLAFLPQFTRPSHGSISGQMLTLGGVFIIATILVFCSIALLAGTLGQWLNRSERIQTILNRVAGSVFFCLALRLATTER